MKNENKEKKPNKFLTATKKIANKVKETTKNIVAKNKENKIEKKLTKLNPLTREEFFSDNFFVPNIIKIVDDAVRRDNELCAGAIGWRETHFDTEILFLYDEFVKESNLNFIPKVSCNSIYIMDNYDRKTFITLDYLFTYSHEGKLAELKNIAYCLGAKKCSIEIKESLSKNLQKSINTEKKDKFSYSYDLALQFKELRHGKIKVDFVGSNDIVYPTLKWFKYDDNIKKLIDMRLNQTNSINSETVELLGSISSTISKQTAINIDHLTKKIDNISFGMEACATMEILSKLIYQIKF